MVILASNTVTRPELPHGVPNSDPRSLGPTKLAVSSTQSTLAPQYASADGPTNQVSRDHLSLAGRIGAIATMSAGLAAMPAGLIIGASSSPTQMCLGVALASGGCAAYLAGMSRLFIGRYW